MRKTSILSGLGIGAGLLVAVAVVRRYRLEKRRARLRLLAGSSVLETTLGPIECAVAGDGPVVLVSHGGGGGYDQGLLVALPLVPSGFRVLSVSRDGYLRSPLFPDSSPQVQAERFAALLDLMGIPRVAVLAISAGGPAGLEFALRYPERCWALAMVSAIHRPLHPPPLPPGLQWGQDVLLQSDFLPWVALRLARGPLLNALGVDPQRLRRDRGLERTIDGILEGLALTPELRRAGTLRDVVQAAALPQYALHALSMPCLVIHGTVDTLVPYEHARRLARSLPEARLLTIRGGGHLCIVTHRDKIMAEFVRFLREHQP